MSLISIAQRETFHISFVQLFSKGYGADLLTPDSIRFNKEKYSLFWQGSKGIVCDFVQNR